VKVYTGRDPVTKKDHYLAQTVPAGPHARREAEKVRTRFQAEVDDRRNVRTRATLDQLLDRWLDVVELEATTRINYKSKLDKHVRPVLGRLQLSRVDPETLESFYAALRKCSARCSGRSFVEHRVAGSHECTSRCRPHKCRGLSASTVRQIHWILSGAFERAVRWRGLGVNPASQASPPSPPHPDPHPPTPEEAARILEAAWVDPDWGALIWLAMTTGARRGELCALRWDDVDPDVGVVTLRRSAFVGEDGELLEKDTKTHQQRRVALDTETVAVLREHHSRLESRLAALDLDPVMDAYVFSPSPDGSRPFRPDSVTQRYGRLARGSASIPRFTRCGTTRRRSSSTPAWTCGRSPGGSATAAVGRRRCGCTRPG
jgi:integrase